jgi:hypothetical protein
MTDYLVLRDSVKRRAPALVTGVVLLVLATTQLVDEGRIRATTASGELLAAERSVTVGRIADTAGRTAPGDTAAPGTPRDNEQIRQRIRQRAAGTYISEILDARDSSLARWPERPEHPPRVWIGAGDDLVGWDSTNIPRVREAFDEWSSVGIPLRFIFADDSADADVRVRWIDHFVGTKQGQTSWTRDQHWWLVKGTITIALHRSTGELLDGSEIKALALHEVGHMLGLDHTIDAANIMAPHVRVRSLSEADRATLSLIYSLPAGPLAERNSGWARRLVGLSTVRR